MANNDFLPFAGGVGSNVLTQSAYAALAARTAGFSAGVAKSAELNKVWRQSSIIASVVAQVVSDITGKDSVDDGATASLVANLKDAIRAQSIGVVGSARNMRVVAPSAAFGIVFNADEVVLESANYSYRLKNFSQGCNISGVGAGGMDIGSSPSNGFVAVYAIYNPVAGVVATLATNAVSAVQPEIYGGASMPAGYTASALISVWPTDSSGRFQAGIQIDRSISFVGSNIYSGSAIGTLQNISSTSFPKNARKISGRLQIGNSAASSASLEIYPDNLGVGGKVLAATLQAGTALAIPFSDLQIYTPQNLFYTSSGGG